MIISVSGRIGSGKDTVGKIIQYLTSKLAHTPFKLEEWRYEYYGSPFQIRKFADKLKDIVCILLGCTREQLEDRTFKEKELGEEWWKFKLTTHNGAGGISIEYKDYSANQELLDSAVLEELAEHEVIVELIKMTPRLLMQLTGTEGGREILHPNIWLNSLFADYKAVSNITSKAMYHGSDVKIRETNIIVTEESNPEYFQDQYPDWIITDTRFPNELKAVKERGGITIRVNRKSEVLGKKDCDCGEGLCVMVGIGKCKFKERLQPKLHESETALDSATFDYEIDNNGSLEELIEQVRNILIDLQLIK